MHVIFVAPHLLAISIEFRMPASVFTYSVIIQRCAKTTTFQGPRDLPVGFSRPSPSIRIKVFWKFSTTPSVSRKIYTPARSSHLSKLSMPAGPSKWIEGILYLILTNFYQFSQKISKLLLKTLFYNFKMDLGDWLYHLLREYVCLFVLSKDFFILNTLYAIFFDER